MESIETWGIVEVMGHKVVAGYLSEETIAGCSMLRIDVPDTSRISKFTKFLSPSAIYGITPTDEGTAKAAAEKFQARPVDAWTLPDPHLSLPFPIYRISL